MRTIHKYSLRGGGALREIQMPVGARALCVQTQDGNPCLWALVDTGNPMVTRTFSVYCTGDELAREEGSYVGTFQMYDGRYVYHLFDCS
jgi:hypothetical protein